jgi:nicotinamide phosphoribosyltransferase
MKRSIKKMRQTSMILMSDFYKQSHAEQYPEGITKLISYATARMSRVPKEMYGDKITVFGIQAYVKDFLIERFNETFFNVSLEEAMAEYNEIIGETFPIKYVDTGKFEALHKLGYLPVEVGCLPEGTRVPIRSAFELPEGQCQVPFMYIINTHPDFPWITEFLESVTSSEVWYPMAIANQAYYYRQIVNRWYNTTGCGDSTCKSAISEFGFRGGKSSDAATKASAAFLTSFNKTATIPAIKYLHEYYNEPYTNGNIGSGMISTEHSVMCSNYAIDGDEKTFLNKLFTKIYPGGALSVVMDSYDYWANLQRCGVGKLREAVMGRAGTVFFRGDSGDPVDIICGYKPQVFATFEDMKSSRAVKGDYVYIKDEQRYYTFSKYEGKWIALDTVPVEVKGTVELIWDMFGGTVNKAGYKVLDSHVRAIYGDSITPNRADAMYKRLAEKGFASCNVVLGAGSFSTQCAEDSNGDLYPFTRDSYGIAVKATWCENKNTEKEYQLFKNPKTDTGKFKKSQKGLIYVTLDEKGEIIAKDGYTSETLPKDGNLLQPIFRNGEMLHEEALSEIRNRLHEGKF